MNAVRGDRTLAAGDVGAEVRVRGPARDLTLLSVRRGRVDRGVLEDARGPG